MNTNKDSELMFAKEDTIFRIVSIAKVIAWVILVVYLISFADDLSKVFLGQVTWPKQAWQLLLSIVNLIYAPVIGLFYFLVLQGVAHGLNLGLDIYYDFQPEGDEEQDLGEEAADEA